MSQLHILFVALGVKVFFKVLSLREYHLDVPSE